MFYMGNKNWLRNISPSGVLARVHVSSWVSGRISNIRCFVPEDRTWPQMFLFSLPPLISAAVQNPTKSPFQKGAAGTHASCPAEQHGLTAVTCRSSPSAQKEPAALVWHCGSAYGKGGHVRSHSRAVRGQLSTSHELSLCWSQACHDLEGEDVGACSKSLSTRPADMVAAVPWGAPLQHRAVILTHALCHAAEPRRHQPGRAQSQLRLPLAELPGRETRGASRQSRCEAGTPKPSGRAATELHKDSLHHPPAPGLLKTFFRNLAVAHLYIATIYLHLTLCQWGEDADRDSAGLGVATTGLPHDRLSLLISPWKQSHLPASPSQVVLTAELLIPQGLSAYWQPGQHPQTQTPTASMWGSHWCTAVVIRDTPSTWI